jgi:hydroxymethylpyrimidine/phosphomethylpyrimidine kinase
MDKTVLTIAGFDPSGCAGIAADIKTFQAWNVHGVAVITTVTAQNTRLVSGVYPVIPEIIQSQFDSILSDIEIHAVKIGLLTKPTVVKLVASLCMRSKLSNIVVDPIVTSTTGYEFADDRAIESYKENLFPIADVITPNISEASQFAGMPVKDVPSMKEAAVRLKEYGPGNVVITGGHLETEAVDVWYDGARVETFTAPKVIDANVRGLGCAFSSILALHLARKLDLHTAIPAAKSYIARAMLHPYKIGKGKGPLNHKQV